MPNEFDDEIWTDDTPPPLTQPSQNYDLRERLVRIEEASRHGSETMRVLGSRVHSMAEFFRALETRTRLLEESDKKTLLTITELKPLADQYGRWQARKKRIKAMASWIIAALTFYATIAANKGNLLDALHALEKMLDASSSIR